MKKQLSIPDAWEIIARAFDQYAGGKPRGGLARNGLCLATKILRRRGSITLQQEHKMDQLIYAALAKQVPRDAYLYPDIENPKARAGLRAIMAQTFAEYTRQEKV